MSVVTDIVQTNATAEHQGVHVATFRLGPEWYGIDVLKVQEVMNPLPLTDVPLAPDYVVGLINVRGLIVTTVSPKVRLGYDERDYGEEYHNVIVNAAAGAVCFMVDEIGDVIVADSVAVSERPSTVAPAAHQYIQGVIKLDGRLITYLDADLLAAV